ncbi:hypothetical protein RUM43_006138 [Polyplax serrata]|uniref:Ras-associating domain-containing protein n=1 Tax=Polyplax serrata TaxID=468196 RepID=A0AAN8S8Y7_POLSC
MSIKLTHEGKRMSTEIPIWVNGEIRWLSGIDKKTTCKDIVQVLLEGEGIDKSEVKDFTIMERWRKVERPLDENSKILKIWSHWGFEKKEVRLCLRRIDNEVDSGRGSPVGSSSTPSIRRKRNRLRGNGKPPWTHTETLHPRRLAELGTFNKKEYDEYYVKSIKPTEMNAESLNQNYIYSNAHSNYDEIYSNNENVNCHKKSTQKSYHCPSTGKLHSTPLADHTNSRHHHAKRAGKCCSKRESKHKVRNSENIEKLMKLILAQGATIQSQLQKLKERDEQIESLEQERHRERIEKNGRNYLLETYLGSLKEAEIPAAIDDEERADDSGVNTEGGSDQTNAIKRKNLERLKQNKTELDSNEIDKIYGVERVEQVRQGEDARTRLLHHYNHHHYNHSMPRTHHKSARSKSESRSSESNRVTLKRTLSDNSLVVAKENTSNDKTHSKSETNTKAKEESDEVRELKSIQSQIHMWEKVFKINKKLEKEEENLVRLHIKIKKYQNESYRSAKEKTGAEEPETRVDDVPEDEEPVSVKKTDQETEQIDCDENHEELQRSLEIVKQHLDQNSKEIYQNFTKLIKEDEKVEEKRSCLSKLLFDLERSKHEEEMLNEMIAAREYQNAELHNSMQFHDSFRSHNAGVHQQTYEQQECSNLIDDKPKDYVSADDYGYSKKQSPAEEYQGEGVNPCPTEVTSVEDKSRLLKSKMVKISFEDQIQIAADVENDHEKSVKQPTPSATGALKGILKNRNQPQNGELDRYNMNESQKYQTFPKNFNYSASTNAIGKNNNFYSSNGSLKNNLLSILQPDDVPDHENANYSQVMMSPTTYNHSINESPHAYYTTRVPNNYELKTVYATKSPNPHDVSKPQGSIYPHSTMVKTKAASLNDNDSSTSSDTSGLCSMYSSSPSVEQPYMEHGYILDTLV